MTYALSWSNCVVVVVNMVVLIIHFDGFLWRSMKMFVELIYVALHCLAFVSIENLLYQWFTNMNIKCLSLFSLIYFITMKVRLVCTILTLLMVYITVFSVNVDRCNSTPFIKKLYQSFVATTHCVGWIKCLYLYLFQ